MKVLVATYPYAGHFNPTQPVVCELVRRGHDVVWMTGPAYAARARQTGARFVAMSPAALIDDANIHRVEGKVTLATIAAYLRRLFVDRIPAQIEDYQRVMEGRRQDGDEDSDVLGGAFAADLLVVEFCTYAARCFHDRAGLPYATLGINPLVTLDPEIPPWGSGEQPPRTALARLANRVRHQLGIFFFTSHLSTALNAQRRGLGLPPRSRWRSFADDVRSPDLHLQMTTPAFEFPRRRLPSSVQFVGPLLPSWVAEAEKREGADGQHAEPENPPWWDELLAHPRERVVHLTQGTISVNTDLLVRPTVEALADRDDLLVVITGKNVGAMFGNPDPVPEAAPGTPPAETSPTEAPADALAAALDAQADTPPPPPAPSMPLPPPAERPPNVRTAAFIPHRRLLPHVGVMVTNAGYNGVLAALSCGVPLVCAGRSEDKADVSSRVAYAGAGIDLATSAPTAASVRAAVLRVLGEQADASEPARTAAKKTKKARDTMATVDPLHALGHDYRAAAARIQADFARHNGPAEVADALEALVQRKAAAADQTRKTKKKLLVKPSSDTSDMA